MIMIIISQSILWPENIKHILNYFTNNLSIKKCYISFIYFSTGISNQCTVDLSNDTGFKFIGEKYCATEIRFHTIIIIYKEKPQMLI
jgi:hypothetical protein